MVSVWRRHLDRAADSGLRLPAVWQQFPDAAVHVSAMGQSEMRVARKRLKGIKNA